MKTLLLGSCLSGIICFETNFSVIGSFRNLRSDFALRVLLGNEGLGCSKEESEKIYSSLGKTLKDERQKDALRKKIIKQNSFNISQ